MRDCDLADSPIASHRNTPDLEADTMRDFLRESFSRFNGNVPATLSAFHGLCFTLIDGALSEAGETEAPIPPATSREYEITIRLLQLFARDEDRHYRMRAYCYLRLLGIEGRSFQQLGDMLGVEKQTVDKCYREIQRRLGDIPGRGDKSPEAREAYRQLRLGQKRPRAPWTGINAWKISLPQPQPN